MEPRAARGRRLLLARVSATKPTRPTTKRLSSESSANAPEALGAFGGYLYAIRQHQGRLNEIADFFIDAANDNPSIAALRSGVAAMLADLGRIDEAHERLAAEVANGLDFPYDATWLASMSDLLDTAAICGDRTISATLIDRVAPFATHVIDASSSLVRGVIARPLARAATLLGDYEQSEAWFDMSHDLHARLRAPFESALEQSRSRRPMPRPTRRWRRATRALPRRQCRGHRGRLRLPSSRQACRHTPCRSLKTESPMWLSTASGDGVWAAHPCPVPRGDKRVPRAMWRAGRKHVDAGETTVSARVLFGFSTRRRRGARRPPRASDLGLRPSGRQRSQRLLGHGCRCRRSAASGWAPPHLR